MSSIDKNTAFNHLVGLIQHQNDNLHKWLAFHFSIQTALMIAVATLMEWSTQNGTLNIGIIIGFGFFGATVSTLVGIILYRNRSYLKYFVQKARSIEGENPLIWQDRNIVKGPGLKSVLNIAHGLIVVGWLVFVVSINLIHNEYSQHGKTCATHRFSSAVGVVYQQARYSRSTPIQPRQFIRQELEHQPDSLAGFHFYITS